MRQSYRLITLDWSRDDSLLRKLIKDSYQDYISRLSDFKPEEKYFIQHQVYYDPCWIKQIVYQYSILYFKLVKKLLGIEIKISDQSQIKLDPLEGRIFYIYNAVPEIEVDVISSPEDVESKTQWSHADYGNRIRPLLVSKCMNSTWHEKSSKDCDMKCLEEYIAVELYHKMDEMLNFPCDIACEDYINAAIIQSMKLDKMEHPPLVTINPNLSDKLATIEKEYEEAEMSKKIIVNPSVNLSLFDF